MTEALYDHPAKYSKAIIDLVRNEVIPTYIRPVPSPHTPAPVIVDPFAGVGGIFDITSGLNVRTVAIEIESRWAKAAAEKGFAVHMNMLKLEGLVADAVITSPVYGNRMSDHHEAKDDSRRHTYRHTYGTKLHPANAGQIHWGDKYRTFHALAWLRVRQWLDAVDSGIFVLNVSDFMKAGKRQRVCAWHRSTLEDYGFTLLKEYKVSTKRQRHGANGDKRVDHEKVYVFKLTGTGRYF